MILLFLRLCNIHISGAVVELCAEKYLVVSIFFFSILIYGVAVANALSLLFALLHKFSHVRQN